MDNPLLPGVLPSPAGSALAAPRGRGRPKGSKNKRSQDLGKYIEAFYGGMTPGQQAAAVGMVTPKDVRASARDARALKLDAVVYAMAVKARKLAEALGCTPKEAWDAMRAERAEVMPYIHQRQAQKVELDAKGSGPMLIFANVDAAGGPATGPAVIGWEGEGEENQILDLMPIPQVGREKSDEGAQPQAPQGFEALPPAD